MHIIPLHELARRELAGLARARYMPKGWNKPGDRKVGKMSSALHKLLDSALLATPCRLMPCPPHARLQNLFRAASSKRLLGEMVVEMVRLLAAEPAMDQENAHACAELADRLVGAHRLLGTTLDALRMLASAQESAKLLEVDADSSQFALETLASDLRGKISLLEKNRKALSAS